MTLPVIREMSRGEMGVRLGERVPKFALKTLQRLESVKTKGIASHLMIFQQAKLERKSHPSFYLIQRCSSRIGFDHGGLRFLATRHLFISAFSWPSEQHDKIRSITATRSSNNKYFPKYMQQPSSQGVQGGGGGSKH